MAGLRWGLLSGVAGGVALLAGFGVFVASIWTVGFLPLAPLALYERWLEGRAASRWADLALSLLGSLLAYLALVVTIAQLTYMSNVLNGAQVDRSLLEAAFLVQDPKLLGFAALQSVPVGVAILMRLQRLEEGSLFEPLKPLVVLLVLCLVVAPAFSLASVVVMAGIYIAFNVIVLFGLYWTVDQALSNWETRRAE